MLYKFFSRLLLLGVWISTLYAYLRAPESIPMHFKFQGEISASAPRISLFFIAAVVSILYLVLGALSNRPDLLHYPATYSADNAESYRRAKNFVLVMRLCVLIVFNVLIV